jgi:hypothetical protein
MRGMRLLFVDPNFALGLLSSVFVVKRRKGKEGGCLLSGCSEDVEVCSPAVRIVEREDHPLRFSLSLSLFFLRFICFRLFLSSRREKDQKVPVYHCMSLRHSLDSLPR